MRFISKHGKQYRDATEYARRLDTFKRNIAAVAKHNAKPHNTVTLGINQFSDMTREEFASTMLGSGKSSSSKEELINAEEQNQLSAPTGNSLDWRATNKVSFI